MRARLWPLRGTFALKHAVWNIPLTKHMSPKNRRFVFIYVILYHWEMVMVLLSPQTDLFRRAELFTFGVSVVGVP